MSGECACGCGCDVEELEQNRVTTDAKALAALHEVLRIDATDLEVRVATADLKLMLASNLWLRGHGPKRMSKRMCALLRRKWSKIAGECDHCKASYAVGDYIWRTRSKADGAFCDTGYTEASQAKAPAQSGT